MYHFKTAYALAKQPDALFTEVDLSSQSMQFIYINYAVAYVELIYDFSKDPVYINLDTIKTDYYASQLTLTNVIESTPNGKFKDIGGEFLKNKIKYVKYGDAIMSGYTLTPNNNNIILSKDGVTNNMLTSTTLATVNGFIHPMEINNGNVEIVNGWLSAAISGTGNVGLITFADVGEIATYSILPSDILLDPTTTPDNLIYIKTPYDDSSKTYLLSLGGYLVLPKQNLFWSLGGGVFAISLNMFGYLYRLLESQNYVYLGSLTPSLNTSAEINSDGFLSQDKINAYLTLFNSFVISVPSSNYISNSVEIIKSPLYNSFKTYYPPNNMLFTGYGRMVDYYYIYNDSEYLVTATNMETPNYNSYSLSMKEQKIMTAQRNPNNPLKNNLIFKQLGFY